MSNNTQKAQEIIDACIKMRDLGLNQGTAGNISLRVDGGMLITPSGMPYEVMKPSDIVFVKNDGTWEEGLIPSTEWRFHLALLQHRPEFNAVVHNHAPYATMVACSGDDYLPGIHYMVAIAGGTKIPCLPYATFGTEELCQIIQKGMEGYKAAILKNHGLITAEKTLEKALAVALEVEHLARLYMGLKATGSYKVLSNEQITVVLNKFNNYGLNVKHNKES
ncbi:MAG: L-fuculose-phosphate aldolase [Treponemataceae bacterium]